MVRKLQKSCSNCCKFLKVFVTFLECYALTSQVVHIPYDPAIKSSRVLVESSAFYGLRELFLGDINPSRV